MKLKNNYFLLRHGEALSNVKNIVSCWPEKGRFPLTQKGRKQIKAAAKKLKSKKIDLIFASPLLRTSQTAEIIGKELKIKPKYDKRLVEHKVGIFNKRPIKELRAFLPPRGLERFRKRIPKGENYNDLKKRMYNFLKDIDKKYSDKNILIVSHLLSLALLELKVKGFSNKDYYTKAFQKRKLETGELKEL